MSEDLIDLARRAVACRGWRWLPGMRAVGRRSAPTAWFRLEEELRGLSGEWAAALPDLSDTATAGCLPRLAREARGVEHLFAAVMWEGSGSDISACWVIFDPVSPSPESDGDMEVCHAATELEAWILALEAAP